MVKFGAEISKARIPEWQPYYCEYTKLKGWIDEMESQASDDKGPSKFKCARAAFMEELKACLTRVDQFFVTREGKLRKEVEGLCANRGPDGESERERQVQPLLEDIEKLLVFSTVNAEAFRKITKKYDKRVGAIKSASEAVTRSRLSWRGPAVGSPDSPGVVPMSLKEFIMENLTQYTFTAGQQRLEPLRAALRLWVKREKLPETILQPLLQASRQSLDLSHLDREDDVVFKASAIRACMDSLLRLLLENVGLIVATVVVAQLSTLNLSDKLDSSSYFVIWVTGVVLVLLLRGLPTDGVMMGAALMLNVCGILTLEEAWGAFSNDVILSVAALGIIADVLARTGIIDAVFSRIVGKPKSLPLAMLRVFLPAIVLNVGISNTCVMSCLLPVISKWSAEIGFHQALFLMPISYLLLISGVFATFSTSTNLIVQGLLATHDETPFDTFALAVPVVCCTGGALVYMLLVVPLVLGRFTVDKEVPFSRGTSGINRGTEKRYNVRVQITGRALSGKSLQDSEILEQLSGGIEDIVSCERYGEDMGEMDEDFKLELNDILRLQTSVDGIVKLGDRHAAAVAVISQDNSSIKESLDKSERQLVQVMLDKESPLIGYPLHSAKDRGNYGASIVGYQQFAHSDAEKMSVPTPSTVVGVGDCIIFDAPHEFYKTWRDSGHFVLAREVTARKGPEGPGGVPAYAMPVSGCITLLMIALVATSTMPLLEAVLLALTALILTNCSNLDHTIKGVKLRTVCVIVGAFGLGKAIGKTRVAVVLAELLLFLLSPLGEIGILSAIFGTTVALGVMFHGTAVVVLMFPVCYEVAGRTGLPIHQVCAVLCISVSCQMLSPISYQTNLMAFTAGGYTFADFTKAGAGLVLVIACIAIPTVRLTFPA